MFMVGHAANAMRFPHLSKECRTVSFPVKNQDESAKMWVGRKLSRGWLPRDILEQARYNIVSQGLEKSRINHFLHDKKWSADGIIDPIISSPS
ncbi:MAG: hypothetical protein COZ11_16155 [Deltaproteobacteria bacterium CG_4_10_14_3_um_filter_51_14]|nr:MAG: hypothetical protein COZ11_16155 [Deltaproteobacteria bacterium CG_4_10_14_3_um_filter_51_14]